MPIQLLPDLRVAIGRDRVAITPREGLRFAEKLIRASTRRMVEEEAAAPVRKPRADARKGSVR